MEIWTYNFLSIMSGYISVESISACAIYINMCAVLYMMPLGGALSATNLVGNSLGANQPRNAKRYATTAIGYIFVISMVVFITLVSLRRQIPYLYTDHEKVYDILVSIFIVGSIFQVFDFVQ